MPCAPCAALLLAADQPTIHGLVRQAKMNPDSKICLCGKCRAIMGADDGGFASWGTGEQTTSQSAVDPSITALTQQMAAGGVSGSPSSDVAPNSTSSNGLGLNASTLIALAQAGIAAFGNKPPAALPVATSTPPAKKPAPDEKAWYIALFVLVVIAAYLMSRKTSKKR